MKHEEVRIEKAINGAILRDRHGDFWFVGENGFVVLVKDGRAQTDDATVWFRDEVEELDAKFSPFVLVASLPCKVSP